MRKFFVFLVALMVLDCVASAQNYDNIDFIENKGQWDSRVKFKGEVGAGSVFIRSNGFTILKHNEQDYQQVVSSMHGEHMPGASKGISDKQLVIRSHAWNVDFVDASPNMQVMPDKVSSSYTNYFIGNDPSKWASECKIYQGVTLKEVYPNIDARYYTYNGTLKYDLIVKPGGDVKKIRLRYEGLDKIEVKDKQLVLRTSLGDMKESDPYTYQFADKAGRQQVNCKYVVKGNIVTFDLKDYDKTANLIIDPTLIFCSFSRSTANNWGFTATYGPDGSFYGGGIVFDDGFPVVPGAFQTSFQGGVGGAGQGIDIGIIKLSPNGANRIYATYIGGSGNEQPHSIICDPQGNLVIAGRSNSSNYPGSSVIGPGGSYDIIVSKLNANGSAMIGSVRIGGSGDDGVNIAPSRAGTNSLQRNYGDDGRSEVILDGAGNIYVASSSKSESNPTVPTDTNFPTTAGVFQPRSAGAQDGVVLKFNSTLSNLLFATYLGGGLNDAAYVLRIGANGNIYVAGGTESTDFPGDHSGTIGTALHGVSDQNFRDIDGFVAQISNDGTRLIKSTYIGTSLKDQIYGIDIDRNGFPYVTGQTEGTWPISNATYSVANGKQFIAKLQPDLSAYVYSTAFGSGGVYPNISPTAFLVDRCENVYVSGWGDGLTNDYPSSGTNGLPVTSDAYKATTDNWDFYFFVLKKDAASQLYGSFFGQNGGRYGDHVDGGTSRFDPNGVIYQGVCANCYGGAAFPTTPGVWGTTNPTGTNGCNLAMIKMAFNLAGVGATVRASIDGVPNDTAGCLPLQVVFTDNVRNAKEYIWNFGDGTGDVGPLPAATGYTQTHTFTAVGNYRVMLVAIDPTSCNIRDTSYINIRVGDLKANLAMSYEKVGPCNALDFKFNNLSTTDISRPFSDTSFVWDFGDGSPTVRAGLNPITHTFPAPGPYTVKLMLNDTTYCNNPDVLDTLIRVAANVDALFNTAPLGCVPYTAVFDNTSIGGATFEWNFGDPASGANNTSTLINPTHEYVNPGTYTVVMVANDPNTCNKTDTARFTLTVLDAPTAAFTYTPVTPIVNTPNVFSNQSSANAVRFKWLFGDGDTLSTTSRADVTHQYNAQGTFTACLIAYNQLGCADTTCADVQTLIVPALDVPNAFTPNSGDINSVVGPKGFGIAKLRFTVYNRWGQKMFETTNRSEGWNGKFKGVLQPMDVYAYTLEVEFFDGKKASKKGDITLIR